MNRKNYSERLRIAAEQNTKEKDFWQKQLAGELVRTGFPYDHIKAGSFLHKPDTFPKSGLDSQTFTFGKEITAKLIEISKGSDYTLNLLLITGIILLLNKYTGVDDIIVGTSIYKPEIKGDFINTILVLRNKVEKYAVFKDFLLQVRQTISDAVKHQNYPIELLEEKLNIDIEVQGEESLLFDVAVLLENIHDKEYFPQRYCKIIFTFRREIDSMTGVVEYDSDWYEKSTIEKIVNRFMYLLHKAVFNINVPLFELDILTDIEKKQLLYDFNNTKSEYPTRKNVWQLFEEQVEKTPGYSAVSSPVDLDDIFDLLDSGKQAPGIEARKEAVSFVKNPYTHCADLENDWKLLKTHRHNSVIINNNMTKLITFFDGKRNLKSVYHCLKNLEIEGVEFIIYSMNKTDLLEVSFQFNSQAETFSIGSFEDLFQVAGVLYRNYLIDLVGMADDSEESCCQTLRIEWSKKEKPLLLKSGAIMTMTKDKKQLKAQVLLLGDTPGIPSTGLLYLGSYLWRGGIEARCQFYDPSIDYTSMKENIEGILAKVQPQIVAISLKWFLYIARVIDMCKIVKEYAAKHDLSIKVVVGGNTASYYWEEMITYDCIDIVVRGDGEEPLLKICRNENEKNIPNCVFKDKTNGKIVTNSITYIQDEIDNAGIYLSHLDELLISDHSSLPGSFFIYTHKGCSMNCFYCGGCNHVQEETFGRQKILRRSIEKVRNDIIVAKKYTSTFQFDFDIPDNNVVDYCKHIWEGIDLSEHFCIFATLLPPSAALINLVSRTFKYIYWDFDICTLSERHRKQLYSLKLIKPQPLDDEILEFMTQCELYSNIEVRLNLITGLPYFTMEDIEPGIQLLDKILHTYTCFGELHWARLHAQPGALIAAEAGKYRMHSYAAIFEDFLRYSEKNFNRSIGYAEVENFDYPYIYFNDEHLNSSVTHFYLESNRKIAQFKYDKKRSLIVCDTLSYLQLKERCDRLAETLIYKQIKPNSIVAFMVERSIEIAVGILGILKAGGAYMPIDPGFPPGRIEHMLKDSNAALLVTTRNLFTGKSGQIKKWQGETIFLESLNLSDLPLSHFSMYPVVFSNLAYIIYTSGTTGKPKGVAIKHENLVNYVNWFSQKIKLTTQDKTILTTSFAFDLGYTSLYTSLLNGCELHILPRETYLLADRLLNYIKQKEITYIKVTPSLLSVIVNAPGFSETTCKSLRLAAVGGEAINVKDIEKAHITCRHLKIMNHYGPTEATIGCVSTIIDFDKFEEYKVQPVIGNPIANANIYILGKDLELLPVGVPGELCISGVGVGMGYLNQPELTAEKFVLLRHSLSTFSLHYRTYRTSDLARWLPNGTIEFLGRIDKQVKIRGYRIELEEIENRLRKHPLVNDALVIVKDSVASGVKANDEKEEKYICAYIVSKVNDESSFSQVTRKEKIENQKKIVTFQELGIKKNFMERLKINGEKIAVKSNKQSLTFEKLDQYAHRLAHLIREKYDDRNKLSKQERTRYIRQMLLAGWGQSSQEKLKSTTVFVAGAGGGASPTVTQLALAGIGTIKICDFDTVELSNLNRQFLHNEERLGMNKAISAQITVGKINPHVKVIPYTQKLTRENVFELVGDSAIIFDMFDGPADKFVLSECAVVKQIPHLIISMTDINAYAAVLHSPYTPCYHCLFDKAKLEAIVSGMKHYVENYSKKPLPVVSTSLFISTGIVVNEALKILLGFEGPAYNKFFYFNQRGAAGELPFTPGYKAMTHLFSDHFIKLCKEQGFDWEIGWRENFLEELKIEPDPDCPVCGPKGVEMRKTLAKQGEKAHNVFYIQEEKGKKEKPGTIALLVNHDTQLAIGAVGAMKSGKIHVPLDTTLSMEELVDILEDSEIRIIVTDDEWSGTAEKLRNRVNTNIDIININRIEEMKKEYNNIDSNEIPTEISLDQPVYMIYSTGSVGNLERQGASMKRLYEALFYGVEYTFEENKKILDTDSLSEEVREYLRKELPDYMIPRYFVSLTRLPLTPNGKLDRRALPEPGLETRKELVAPRNECEETFMEIWSALLGKEKNTFGIDSNFFELGGHSLNATIMAARVNKELNVKLPVGEVFKTPTIRELSRYLIGSEEEIHTSIQPVEKKEFYPLSSAQMRMFLLSQIKTTTSDNIPGVYQVEGPLNYQHLENTINRMIKRHELLRTSFIMLDHQPVQRVHESVVLKVILIEPDDETHSFSNQQIKDIVDNFAKPFDLGKAPLLRVSILKLEEEKHLLIYDMHHIISDGTSFQVFIQEFISFYMGMELPPINVQYKDFTIWQNNLKGSVVHKKQEKYWLNLFSGEIPSLNLPTDYPRPLIQDFEGNTITFIFDSDLITGINEIALKEGATLYMALLAIYNILLYKLTGQEDIVVGSSSAGRPHADLENVIGFFVNTLALRNHPLGEITFLDFIKEVKSNALKAYENQDYQFDELVNGLGNQRDVGRQILFDTHFTLHNIHVENSNVPKVNSESEFSKLRFINYPMEMKTTQFDIIIHANQISEGVHFILRYRTRLFKRETMERFAKHYENIARIVVKNENIKLKDIKITYQLETAHAYIPEVNFNF